MSPDISVIIAAYNVEGYIERAINSTLTQADYADAVAIEVIVVDDGSTDRTWDIISGISDPRLQCFNLPCNGGPGLARNAGIDRASGKWIAVLDGDDAFFPGRLERLAKLANIHKADIVVDNLSVFRESDGVSFPMFSPSRLARISPLSLSDFIAGNQSFMGGYALGYMKPFISAAFLRQHKLHYNVDIRIGEDYLLLARALAAGAHCIVEPMAGYLYTSRCGSISHRLTRADILRIALGDERFISEYKLPPAAVKAQKKREAHLKDAYAFICLVEALKARNVLGALQAVATAPLTVLHLWRPVWQRIRKLSLFMLTEKENWHVRSKKYFNPRS